MAASAMLDNMRRLHPRGAANRGICVDAEGAMLGPDCVLVYRSAYVYLRIPRRDANALQKLLIREIGEPDWLFRQCGRIADSLRRGELALAQIYGLRIPIGELDGLTLARLAASGFAKAGYNPED